MQILYIDSCTVAMTVRSGAEQGAVVDYTHCLQMSSEPIKNHAAKTKVEQSPPR